MYNATLSYPEPKVVEKIFFCFSDIKKIKSRYFAAIEAKT